jgi:hypothetical protein
MTTVTDAVCYIFGPFFLYAFAVFVLGFRDSRIEKGYTPKEGPKPQNPPQGGTAVKCSCDYRGCAPAETDEQLEKELGMTCDEMIE